MLADRPVCVVPGYLRKHIAGLDSSCQPAFHPPAGDFLHVVAICEWENVGGLVLGADQVGQEVVGKTDAVNDALPTVLEEFAGGPAEKVQALTDLAKLGIHAFAEDAVD